MTVKQIPSLDAPRLSGLNSLIIAGLRKQYSSQTVTNIPLLWRQLEPYWGAVPARIGKAAFGLIMDMNNPGGLDYVAGFEVSSETNLPAELVIVNIPPQKYAIFVHRGHASKLRETMAAIWHEWLPSSGYKLAHGSGELPDAIEHYGEGFNPQTGMGDIEVWIPIKKS